MTTPSLRVLRVGNGHAATGSSLEASASAVAETFSVAHADGAEAVALLEADAFDVLVLHSGPTAGGLEALRRIQSAAPDLPVVVCVDERVGIGDEAFLRAGAEEVCREGAPEVLAQKVRHALARKAGRARRQAFTEKAFANPTSPPFSRVGDENPPEAGERSKIRELEAGIGRLLEDALSEIYIFDEATLQFVQVNRGARENLGYSMEELRRMTPVDLKPEFTLETFLEVIRPLVSGEKELLEFDTVHRRKDGSLYPAEVHLQRATLGNRSVLVAFVLDVTERRRTGAEMRKLALVAKETDNAVVITDPDGYIEWVNEGFTRITGYTLAEVVGKKPGTVLQGPETDPETVQRIREAVHARERIRAEILNYGKKGDKYWLEIFIQPVFDERGELECFIAIEADITARKEAEEALAQSKARLAEAQRIAEMGSWEWSRDTDTLYWSEGLYRITGLEPGTPPPSADAYLQMVHPEDREWLKQRIRELFSDGFMLPMEYRLCTANGDERWLRTVGYVVTDESGEVVRTVGTSIDITEQKRAEIALERGKRAQETFARRLKKLHAVHTRTYDTIEELLDAYLREGCEVFDMSTGIVSRVEGSTCRVLAVRSDIEALEAGQVFELEGTYCHAVVRAKETVAYARVGAIPEMCGHPVYVNLHPESYISTPIFVNGQLYGTLNYSSTRARDQEFEEHDREIIELMAQGIGRYLELDHAEKARKHTEEELDNFFKVSLEMLCVVDADGFLRRINPAWTETLGYTEEELCARPLITFVHPEDRADTVAELEKITRGAVKHNFENRYRCKGGGYRWLSWTCRTAADGMLYAVARDVTEHKRASEALRTTTTRLSTLIENMQAGIVVEDENRRIVLINGTMCDMFDVEAPPEALLGADCSTFAREKKAMFVEPERFEQRVEEILREREVVTNEEIRLVDGRTFERDYIPIFVEGIYQGHLWQYTDVTEQNKLIDLIRETQAMALVGGWEVDLQTNTLMWTDEVYRIHELPLGSPVDVEQAINYYHPDSIPVLREALDRAMETGEGYDLELKLITARGREIWVRAIGKAHRSDGRTYRLSGTFQDITQLKKVERLKNEFVSVVSHELRTPLTSISGSLGLVMGGIAGELPDRARTMIGIAHRNAERLVRLINDILDIQKIESGVLSLNRQPVDLTALVRQSLEANASYGENYGVTFNLYGEAPVQVYADSDRLLQVMANLLSNAAKFAPSGSMVGVKMERVDDRVRVSVSDEGPGIPVAFRDRIFQKFAQADASNTRQKEGTGLGLSISQSIIEVHGGSIGFETEEGIGTTFYFELPVHREAEAVPEEPVPKQSSRVLICEDDQAIVDLLLSLLEGEDYQVDVARSAQEAEALLARHSYDAITMDLLLPDGNGISLIRKWRTIPGLREVPIMVVSANASAAGAEVNGGVFGVVDWLDKPINEDRLREGVRSAIANASKGIQRVLHVEDDADTAQVVGAVLGELATVDHVTTIREAREQLAEQEYDLVLLDLGLPDGSGLEVLESVEEPFPSQLPVVIYSAQEIDWEVAHRVAAMLVKTQSSIDKLYRTIRSLLRERKPQS